MMNLRKAIMATIVGILLNIVLSFLVASIVSEEQAEMKGNILEEMIHMLVKHNKMIISSSIIVGLVVLLSVLSLYLY